jgi:probable F420-dependent oxidoreductase
LDGLGPVDVWNAVVNAAQRIHDMGYETLWCGDHVHPSPWLNHTRPTGTPRLVTPVVEVWTTLAGLSQCVPTLRLGSFVSAVGFRSPALLAKQAAMVDVMSGGRMELGIGAGWFRAEHEAYAVPFRSNSDRIEMLREAVQIVRRLWTESDVSFEGKHYRLVRAQLEPKPIQQRPPILIGGSGHRMLHVVAECADKWNFMGELQDFTEAQSVLRFHCEEIGREPDSIVTTWGEGGVVIRESEAEARRVVERVRHQTGIPEFRSWLWGTPERVFDQIAPFVRAGVREIMPHMPERDSTESLHLFITRVAPELRRLA